MYVPVLSLSSLIVLKRSIFRNQILVLHPHLLKCFNLTPQTFQCHTSLPVCKSILVWKVLILIYQEDTVNQGQNYELQAFSLYLQQSEALYLSHYGFLSHNGGNPRAWRTVWQKTGLSFSLSSVVIHAISRKPCCDIHVSGV